MKVSVHLIILMISVMLLLSSAHHLKLQNNVEDVRRRSPGYNRKIKILKAIK
jgi:hypothetical protein